MRASRKSPSLLARPSRSHSILLFYRFAMQFSWFEYAFLMLPPWRPGSAMPLAHYHPPSQAGQDSPWDSGRFWSILVDFFENFKQELCWKCIRLFISADQWGGWLFLKRERAEVVRFSQILPGGSDWFLKIHRHFDIIIHSMCNPTVIQNMMINFKKSCLLELRRHPLAAIQRNTHRRFLGGGGNQLGNDKDSENFLE